MVNPSIPPNKPSGQLFHSNNPLINDMSSINKTSYITNYTLRDVGEIDQTAKTCIIDMNNPIYSDPFDRVPRIQTFQKSSFYEFLTNKGISVALSNEIFDLLVLTTDYVKSIGKPLILTENAQIDKKLNDYYYYSSCIPPEIPLSTIHSLSADHQEVIKAQYNTHKSSLPDNIANCMPYEPIVVEVSTQQILASKKFTTIFVSGNGSLYHLYFSNKHGNSTNSVISMYDDPGNEAQTNKHYSTYDKYNSFMSSKDIIKNITLKFHEFDFQFTLGNGNPIEYTSEYIPKHERFGILENSTAGNSIDDLLNTSILFSEGQDSHQLFIDYTDKNRDGHSYRPMISSTPISKSKFKQLNAQDGIVCSMRYLGCSTDDSDRTAGKLNTLLGTFRDWDTQLAVEKCSHLAKSNGHNTIALQYDNQCWSGSINELELNDIIDKNPNYKRIDTHLSGTTTDETNNNAVTKSKTCTINKASKNHIAGGPWSNALYSVQSDACYNYSNVRLVLDEEYGFYLERTYFNSTTPERLIFWDIKPYKIDSMTDLDTNTEWANSNARFPDGEIKHNEFISLGQVLLSKNKTLKVYLDQKGFWRILISIKPCSINAERILKAIRQQYDNQEWNSMFSNAFDHGPDGTNKNGSIYNPSYHARFLRFYPKIPPSQLMAAMGGTSSNLVLKFKSDYPETDMYYRLKPEELQSSCNNFIHDKMAYMPIDIFNIGHKPFFTAVNMDDTDCRKLCQDEKNCDFAILQEQQCNLYDISASKYLMNNSSLSGDITSNHNVYRKVCLPGYKPGSNTDMLQAGFITATSQPFIPTLGGNFMVLNEQDKIDNFFDHTTKNDTIPYYMIEYKNIPHIVKLIQQLISANAIDLHSIGYKDNSPESINKFITDVDVDVDIGYPQIPFASVNKADVYIKNFYTKIYFKKITDLQQKANTTATANVGNNNTSIATTSITTSKISSENFQNLQTSTIDNSTIDNARIDKDTENINKLIREIQKMINNPYPIQSQENTVFSPEVIILSIAFISLLFILYRLHKR